MGLDMMLVKRKKDLKKENKEVEWNETVEIAYWRKANQVHKWFVDNVQNGVDDCGYYEVTIEKLQELVDICREILREVKLVDGKVLTRDYWEKEKGETEMTHIKEYGIGKVIDKPEICKKLLPTQDGFFFGDTNYSEYYYEDIEYTRNRIQAVIDLLEWELYDVYYTSSW